MKRILTLFAILILLTPFSSALASDDEHGYRSKLYGTVEHIPEGRHGTWTIDGRSVEVTSHTEIEAEYAPLAVGAYVEVEGRNDGKTFYARELEVKRGSDFREMSRKEHQEDKEEFYGTIKAMPQGGVGTWLVDDREIFVDANTRIETEHGPASLGSRVEVKGHLNGPTFYARKIETKSAR